MRRPEGLVGLLIFNLIDEKPRYGYEIIKKLEEISGGYWQPGQGTVYGALERLDDEGLIEEVDYETGDGDNSRQYYGLTGRGRDRLKEYRKECAERINPKERILGLIYVYRFLSGEGEFEKLLTKIEREFSLGNSGGRDD